MKIIRYVTDSRKQHSTNDSNSLARVLNLIAQHFLLPGTKQILLFFCKKTDKKQTIGNDRVSHGDNDMVAYVMCDETEPNPAHNNRAGSYQ